MGDDQPDFEAEGLLAGLSGEAREARARLLAELHADGASLEELRRAVEADRLALLPVERALSGEQRYSLRDVAEQSGVALELLERNRRALGFSVPDPDEVLFDEETLQRARGLKVFLDAGLPEEGMLDVARVIGEGMARLAASTRQLVAESVVQTGTDEHDVGTRLAQAASALSPLIGPQLASAYKEHLAEMVRSDVVSAGEVAQGRIDGASEIAVCFADFVGFTSFGERSDPEVIGEIADELGRMATAVVEPPVRLVKTIGDAAMLVSREPGPLVGAALGLVEAADAAGDLPQLRAGLALGSAIGRGGDVYGRPVNLASRITGIARPGSVLATAELVDLLPDEFRWSFAGPHTLKGVREPINLFRARFLEEETSAP